MEFRKKEFELQIGYRDNDRLRAGLNKLALNVLGLDFEDWFQNGFWKEKYILYSLTYKDQVVANISVNHMEFDFMGKKKNYIQLGTVMTDESYRKEGMSRFLMEEILRVYKDKTEGIYLFANDTVLDFYPKFGFRRGIEYHYEKTVQNTEICKAVPVSMQGKDDWYRLVDRMRESIPNSSFEMRNNEELIMFYISGYMKECVYYVADQEAYVIAEAEGENLFIHHVFSGKRVEINSLIKAFGKKVRHVSLGFTPMDTSGYILSEARHSDTTLFFMGRGFEEFDKYKLMFPILSHA